MIYEFLGFLFIYLFKFHCIFLYVQNVTHFKPSAGEGISH